MAIFNDHFSIAKEASKLSSRRPEFRLMPVDFMGGGVIRLAAIVETHAAVRRPGSSLFLVETRKFNQWARCDAAGKLPEGII